MSHHTATGLLIMIIQQHSDSDNHFIYSHTSIVILCQAPAVPRYLFLVGLLPLFPLILVFAGSSAIAFVLTTSIEFILR